MLGSMVILLMSKDIHFSSGMVVGVLHKNESKVFIVISMCNMNYKEETWELLIIEYGYCIPYENFEKCMV